MDNQIQTLPWPQHRQASLGTSRDSRGDQRDAVTRTLQPAWDKSQGQASNQPFFSARSLLKETKDISGQRGVWRADISLGFVSGFRW